MTTYNTGNPIGSTAVKDLYDNAENLDNFSNGAELAYADRLGVSRQSLAGIRAASSYQHLGAYGAGLQFTSYNQTFSYLGEFYAPSAGVVLPYTTTGVGAAEIATFRSVGDATLRGDLAGGGAGEGAELIEYDGGTVESALDSLISENSAQNLVISALSDSVVDNASNIARLSLSETKSLNSANGFKLSGGFAPVRCVNILGDSISYGANAQDIQRDSWVGIFGKMLNLEYGLQNIGWLNAVASTSNAEGVYLNYHTQTGQTGTWAGITNAAAGHIPSGYALQSSVAASTLVYKVPTSQRYMRVWYDGTVTGEIEVVINSVVVQTLTATGAGTGYERGAPLELATLTATNNGVCTFTIRCKSGTVRLTGFEFTNQTAGEFRLNNFSRDGRAGRYVSQDVINRACAGCYFMVWALGANDSTDAAAVAEYAQRVDWLIAAAAANRTRVVVIDMRFIHPDTDPIRLESKRAAESIPGAVYIDVAKTWAAASELSGTEITERNLSAGIHPEEPGHRLIAEVVAQRLGLGCTSKRDAIRRDPMWNALDISASGLANSSNVPGSQTAWRIGERAIELIVGLTTVPVALVSIGTIPSTAIPSGMFTTTNIKSNPDTTGKTGIFLFGPSGLLRYQPDPTSSTPSVASLNASIQHNDTATWY